MTEVNKRLKLWIKVIRFIMMILFVCGFVYQTLQFLFLYWTYPTVVDIQQSSPTYVEIPAFTFCNRLGFRFENICEGFDTKQSICTSPGTLSIVSRIICAVEAFAAACPGGSLPEGFQMLFQSEFMQGYSLKREDFPRFAMSLEEYMNCTIEHAGSSTPCNMENVLGSFYTEDNFPQFCYTIYSKWGQPNKKRELIPKGATMKFKLFLNLTRRGMDENGKWLSPLYNPPCEPTTQIAVHSPYFLPSPYFAGSPFLGGRAYELRIKLSERNLLPYPYQTNCTDYMASWKARNGKAPINQLSTIQECRINKTVEKLGCIPVIMDYPHPYNICKSCPTNDENYDDCPYVEPPNDCSQLADSFNQACHSLTYTVSKENKDVVVIKRPESIFVTATDGLRFVLPMHECEGENVLKPECSTITIDVPFDQFEITNITYNAKYESLELFSVIGGYMGMWLGISLLAVYDIVMDALAFLRSYSIKRNKSKVKRMKLANASREVDQFSTYNTVYKSSEKKS